MVHAVFDVVGGSLSQSFLPVLAPPGGSQEVKGVLRRLKIV